MTNDKPEKQSHQPLAEIQHSQRGQAEPDPRSGRPSSLVGDPKNRLKDGERDPETDELKPASE